MCYKSVSNYKPNETEMVDMLKIINEDDGKIVSAMATEGYVYILYEVILPRVE